MATKRLILAIDTSCDDTSVAIVDHCRVVANVVASQYQIHRHYGGVFPTLAKQAHQANLPACLNAALHRAGLGQQEPKALAAVAVTVGPGLAPALEVGIAYAQQLAQNWHLPLIGVNHIEAHALSPLLRPKTQTRPHQVRWPVLAMVVSGGHSEFILISKPQVYQRLGWTIDDSAGECLDKIGRMLDLGYPAGPLIEQLAKKGDAQRFTLPLAMTDHTDFNLSFSGLKTAAYQLIEQLKTQGQLDAQTSYDLAASLQQQVFRQLNYKLWRLLLSDDLSAGHYPQRKQVQAITKGRQKAPLTPINELWLGGGVAANISLRRSLRHTLQRYASYSGKQIALKTPYHKKFCGDNAAMIGLVAHFADQNGQYTTATASLDRQPRLTIGQSPIIVKT